MAKAVCRLDHPIIFIFDYDCEATDIPEYDRNEVVSANEYCLSVRAISDVDGEVRIGLNDGTSVKDMVEVFAGMIGTPNRKVAIVDSNNEKLLETEVSSSSARIQVWVDSSDFPGQIEVTAHEALS